VEAVSASTQRAGPDASSGDPELTKPTNAPLRIAWTGSAVLQEGEDTAATALGRMLLTQALERGVEVDLYHPGSRPKIPQSLRRNPNLVIIEEPVKFEWDRWYSRIPVAAFVSGSAARILTQVKLARRLIANHRRRHYHAIFQFSQLELLALGWARGVLPPIVIHPCTTSARELHWHRKESRYALGSESRLQHYLVRTLLRFRTLVQRHELKKPRLIVAGPSETFNRLLCEDYGVELARTRVLRHPVDVRRFGDLERGAVKAGPVVLLYVSRFSARKGLELITALSHRLADLAGEVEIKLLGGGSLWSDYTAHLKELNPDLAKYIGGVSASEMPKVYGTADAVVVPSHYEPGSLVVGEALSAGLPIVASDQVGPVEVVDGRVCRVFPAGDLDALEREVRTIVAGLRGDHKGAMEAMARREANTHFAAEKIGLDLIRILDEVRAPDDSQAAVGAARMEAAERRTDRPGDARQHSPLPNGEQPERADNDQAFHPRLSENRAGQ
jgi:glycosyltransferase involved in cell wall biosynthesis